MRLLHPLVFCLGWIVGFIGIGCMCVCMAMIFTTRDASRLQSEVARMQADQLSWLQSRVDKLEADADLWKVQQYSTQKDTER